MKFTPTPQLSGGIFLHLSPLKLHPLLEEKDPQKDSPKNLSFWTFAAHMTQIPPWLDVLPIMWACVSVEVLPLQYSVATGHFRLGVSCVVPGTSCLSTARNTTKAPVTTLL